MGHNIRKHWKLSLKSTLFYAHRWYCTYSWPGWIKLHEPQTFTLSQGRRKGLGESSQVGKLKVCFGKCTCFSFTSTPLRPLMLAEEAETRKIPEAKLSTCSYRGQRRITVTTEDGKWKKGNETQSSTRRQIHHVDKHEIKGDHKAGVRQMTCVSDEKQAKDSTGRQWRWFQLFKNQNKIGWSLNKILRYWIKIANRDIQGKPFSNLIHRRTAWQAKRVPDNHREWKYSAIKARWATGRRDEPTQQENRKFREFFWVNNEIQTPHCSLRKQDDCLTLCPNHQHLPPLRRGTPVTAPYSCLAT